MSDGYLTVQQVADLAQIEHKTVRRAIAAGQLEAFRVGSRIRIRETDARAWIESRPVGQPAPRPRPPSTKPRRLSPQPDSIGSVTALRDMERLAS